jgi:photosystem II stability/assembly factor-like uncharacterized protein
MAPSRPDILVAGTRTGVFRSQDSGQTWQRISAVDDQELHNVDSLAIDPRNPDLIYVGTYHLPWKTLDSGKSWVPVIAGIIDDSDIMSMRIDATNSARLFMSACSGIYRSENQGAQWTKLQGIPYSARRTQAIVQDPGNANTLFAGTTEGLWVTRDGGESWTRTTPKDWDVTSLVVIAADEGHGERLVLGTEGRGVEISDDAGVHFSEANQGFTHSVITVLLADPRDASHLLMTTQRAEERLLESHDSGKTWNPIPLSVAATAKSGNLSVDQFEQVYATPWGWLLRMADEKFWLRDEGRNTWNEWKLHLPPDSASAKKGGGTTSRKRSADQPLVGSQLAFSQNAAFVSTSAGLLRCFTSGACGALKAFGRGGEIRALRASPNAQNLFVVRDGKLGISGNGGESAIWRDLPVANEQVIWLDLADSSSSLMLGTAVGLYLSKGPDAPWEKVRGGLPEAAVTHGLRQASFWVVTERNGGMYFSADSGGTWQRVDRDAERSQFAGLQPVAHGLLAASESEGLLRLDLATPKNTAGK